jgi:peptidyl-prolyl cis-trans isomerase SurA
MKRIGIFLTALVLLAGWSLRARAQERMIGEDIVAIVGSSMILWSDVAEAMQMLEQEQRARGYTSNRDPQCEALEALLLRQVLVNQARIDSLEPYTAGIDLEIENQIDNMIEQYGSMVAMEAVYRKPLYQIRDDLREKYMDMAMAQEMEMTVRSDVSVVPSEVERFYRRTPADSLPLIPEQYVYAQIVMYPPSQEEAKLRARTRLLALRERIIGGENFATLARLFSVDGSAVRGGEMDPTPFEGLVRPFAEALQKLRPNQISPVVETEFGFHIIQLLEQQGDLYRFRHILLKPEYTTEELAATAHKLDSVAGLIRDGELTFEAAAVAYSEDGFTKYNGGVVTNSEIMGRYGYGARATSERFTREDLGNMGNDYAQIRSLTPGQLSGAYVTSDMRGDQQVKLIKLLEIVPSHRAGLENDYGTIEDMALQNKQNETYDAWLEKTLERMYIHIDERFRACDFEVQGLVK